MFPIVFTAFIDMVGIGIVIPVLEPLIDSPTSQLLPAGASMHLRYFLYGLLVAAYPLAQFFGAPLLGTLSDRYGRKKLLLLSQAGTLIGFVLMALGVWEQSLWMLFFARALDGFTGGNISIAYAAASDLSKPETRARNFGLIGMAFGLGFILGPFIGGELSNPNTVSWFGPSTPFLAAALLCGSNMLLLMLLFRETMTQPRIVAINPFSGFRNIGKAFGNPQLRTIFIVVFLVTTGFSFFTQFMPVYLRGRFGWEAPQVGRFYAYIGIWIAVAQGLVVNLVTRRWKSPQILRVTLLTLSLAVPAMLLPDQGWMLLVVAPFIALSQGISTPNLNAVVSLQAPADHQGEILGMNQSVAAIGNSIAPLTAGLISGFSIFLPTITSAFLMVAGWLIFVLILFPKLKR
jgi:DHA1 family tetracycline resistance protein-like MFS transporter